MKKKLLVAILLLVCFWHINVRAEEGEYNFAQANEVGQIEEDNSSNNSTENEETVRKRSDVEVDDDSQSSVDFSTEGNNNTPIDNNLVLENGNANINNEANQNNANDNYENENNNNNLSLTTSENNSNITNPTAPTAIENDNNDNVLANNENTNGDNNVIPTTGGNNEEGDNSLNNNVVSQIPGETNPETPLEGEDNKNDTLIPGANANLGEENNDELLLQQNGAKENSEPLEEPQQNEPVGNVRLLSGAKVGGSGESDEEETLVTEFGIHFAGSDPVKLSELIKRLNIQFLENDTIEDISLVSTSGKLVLNKDSNILNSTITRLDTFEASEGSYDIFTIQTAQGVTYTIKMDGKEPNHSKTLTPNTTVENGQVVNDGTYKLSLTFTGEQEYDIKSVNVVLILDTSNSMSFDYTGNDTPLGDSSYYDIYDENILNSTGINAPGVISRDGNKRPGGAGKLIQDWSTDTIYGIVDYQYVALEKDGDTYKYNGATYDGPLFVERTGNRRFYSEFKAVDDMGLTLLSKNDTMPGIIQIALVSFNKTSHVATDENNNPLIFDKYESTDGTSYGFFDFVKTANGFDFAQWTNWEAALTSAKSIIDNDEFGDDDSTFVIFVSDGEPTAYINGTSVTTGLSTSDKKHAYTSYNKARIQAYNMVHTKDENNEDIINDNIRLYSIGAYGTLSSMEDLVNYAYNGHDDYNYSNNTAYDETYSTLQGDADGKYYRATDDVELKAAFNSITSLILSGIKNAVINDGTTSKVTLTSNAHEGLLDVDTTSFEYFLSWEVTETASNKYTFDLFNHGKYITYNVDVNGTTVTITDTSTGKTSEYQGTISTKDGITTLRVKWDGVRDFYSAPPIAQFTDGDVKWSLSSLGTLLDKVTYEVTFDVWPSQTTYDLIADLENGVIEYYAYPDEYVLKTINGSSVTYTRLNVLNNTSTSITERDITASDVVITVENERYYKTVNGEKGQEIVPPQVIKYLTPEHDLITNTEGDAYVEFDDTRSFGYIGTSTYKVPKPVGTDYAEMLAVTKIWEYEGDNNPYPRVDFHVSKDGAVSYLMAYNTKDKKYEAYISVGIITDHGDDDIHMKTSGHNYGFVETGSDAYHWELISNTVRPMLINTHLTMLVLIEGNDTHTPEYTIVEITDTTTGEIEYKIFKGKNISYSNNDTTKVYYYYVDSEGNNNSASCTSGECVVINQIRSNLDILKTVHSLDEDSVLLNNQEFEFAVQITSAYSLNPDDEYIWFSVVDTNSDDITKPLYLSSNQVYATGTGQVYAEIKNLTIIEGGPVTDVNVYLDNTTGRYMISYKYNGTPYTVDCAEDNCQAGEVTSGTIKYYTNYYYVNSGLIKEDDGTVSVGEGTRFKVKLKNGYQLRFLNILSKSEYTITEIKPTNYDLTINPDTGIIITGTNANATITDNTITGIIPSTQTDYKIGYDNYELTNVKVIKNWDDANDQDGKRSGVVAKIDLYKTVDSVLTKLTTESITVGTDQGWSQEWNGLPAFELVNNVLKTITYSIIETLETANGYENTGNSVVYVPVEETSDGYTEGYYKITITNKYEPELVDVKVIKNWDDASDQDGKRVDVVAYVELWKTVDGSTTSTKVYPNETNKVGYDQGWYKEWTDLPAYEVGEVGKKVTYTVQEVLSTANGYAHDEEDDEEVYTPATETANGLYTITITNIHVPEKISKSGEKCWDDWNNIEGFRPGTITIYLLADYEDAVDYDGKPVQPIEVSGDLYTSEGWNWTFDNLPKYSKGAEINYTVREELDDEAKDWYEVEFDPYGAYASMDVTNIHEVKFIVISGKKIWDDVNDKEGFRPESITITLKANDGTAYDYLGNEIQPITVTEEDNWEWSFGPLLRYKDKTPITYTIVETLAKELEDIYAISYSDPALVNSLGDNEFYVAGLNKICTYDEETTFFMDENGEKVDTLPFNVEIPSSVTLPNGKVYTWDEEKEEYLDEKGNVCTLCGAEYVENIFFLNNVDFYEGLDVTNNHIPVPIQVHGDKYWNDFDNIEGFRPESITITLLADGNPAVDFDGNPVDSLEVKPVLIIGDGHLRIYHNMLMEKKSNIL